MARTVADIRSKARAHTDMAINTLVGVCRAKGAPPSARVAAASELLDRGWGRAAQVHSDPDGGPIQVVIRQIIDITGENSSEPVLIEGQVIDTALSKRSLT